jgi:hypothetical protein
MSPDEKRRAVAIVEEYGGNAWNVDCCRQLSRELSVPMSQLNQLQPCIFLAIEHPGHLDRGIEELEETPTELHPEVVAAEAARANATHDLSLYQLKPAGLKGEELLTHMIQYSKRTYKGDPSTYGVASYLAVDPTTPHQRALLSMNYHQRAMGTIMEDVNSGISLKKAVQTRMNNIGEIGGQSGLVNDPKRNELIKFRLQLMQSQAEVTEHEQKQRASKRKAAAIDMKTILPHALHLYDSVDSSIGTYPRAFTKKHCEAILTIVLSQTINANNMKRNEMILELQKQLESKPTAIHDAMGQYPYSESTEPPQLPSPNQAVAVDEQNTANVPASPARSMSRILYRECIKATAGVGCNISALNLALLVLEFIQAVKSNYEYDEEDLYLYTPRDQLWTRLARMLMKHNEGDTKWFDFVDTILFEKFMLDLLHDEGLDEDNLRDASNT